MLKGGQIGASNRFEESCRELVVEEDPRGRDASTSQTGKRFRQGDRKSGGGRFVTSGSNWVPQRLRSRLKMITRTATPKSLTLTVNSGRFSPPCRKSCRWSKLRTECETQSMLSSSTVWRLRDCLSHQTLTEERLIRRAHFDLIGLPPAPVEVDNFVNDSDPLAYENLIERLLESPQYGERWGRYWLDLAGYADSDGVNADDPIRPYAYRYRDYVIQFIQRRQAVRPHSCSNRLPAMNWRTTSVPPAVD